MSNFPERAAPTLDALPIVVLDRIVQSLDVSEIPGKHALLHLALAAPTLMGPVSLPEGLHDLQVGHINAALVDASAVNWVLELPTTLRYLFVQNSELGIGFVSALLERMPTRSPWRRLRLLVDGAALDSSKEVKQQFKAKFVVTWHN
ncbi:hypothetical protein GGF32_003762 [Allomyces javanicus]|nr:hypothetical protein GGF32_003762 [Allomyces javanicus]